MTHITLNGAARTVAADATVGDLVSAEIGREIGPGGRVQDGRPLGVAVARNSEVVPRSLWASRVLAEGDAVELVTAAQGG